MVEMLVSNSFHLVPSIISNNNNILHNIQKNQSTTEQENIFNITDSYYLNNNKFHSEKREQHLTIDDHSSIAVNDPLIMSTSSVTATEKPSHYRYLKEFRVEQCQLFPQHKCSQHRPFTCFNWHFPNQRRRRPVRKRDGTFNYSPDNYCTKYDEASGTCPEGDDCPLLHRTAGDTERRYHLRYFKTCMCVYETDSKSFCTKNGAHCAFAHGEGDKRPPVFDIREQQVSENLDESMLNGPNQLDKERNMMVDDPKWQDTNYVLAHYKTELCKRPPRLCRQGYACPQYHNERDRRRSPKQNKYRSTPCPNVKRGDEWGEPSSCEDGDGCSYCHTRTEQQFHPEIYKSSKCHDVFTNQYCPRGPFCAFGHTETEMQINRNLPVESNLVSDILIPVLPQGGNNEETRNQSGIQNSNEYETNDIFKSNVSTTGSSLFGTQSFANAVALSYSNATAGNVINNNGLSKGYEDNHTKKNLNDSMELLNGTSSNNVKLIMDSFIHVDPDGYTLFPSSRNIPKDELKGDDSPNTLEKDTDSEHFGGSDISSLSGSSKPVSIPSPSSYFQQQRERLPSGSSSMAPNPILNNYSSTVGSRFNKSDLVDQNSIVSSSQGGTITNGYPQVTTSLSSSNRPIGGGVIRNGVNYGAIGGGSSGFNSINNSNSGTIIGGCGTNLNAITSVMANLGLGIGNGGSNEPWNSLISSSSTTSQYVLGNIKISELNLLSTETLKRCQKELKYQLDLVEKALNNPFKL